jgi:hypothetical protein
MGFETALRFSYSDEGRVREVLRPLSTLFELADGSFEFRTRHAPTDWPDASVWLKPWGLMFCDHGGPQGKVALTLVVAALEQTFGTVVVDDDV